LQIEPPQDDLPAQRPCAVEGARGQWGHGGAESKCRIDQGGLVSTALAPRTSKTLFTGWRRASRAVLGRGWVLGPCSPVAPQALRNREKNLDATPPPRHPPLTRKTWEPPSNKLGILDSGIWAPNIWEPQNLGQKSGTPPTPTPLSVHASQKNVSMPSLL